MKFNVMGRTGLLVSEICFGTMSFGGEGFWKVVGKQKQEEATSLVKIAFDKGVNFFDTANAYSFGVSETMLGKALRDLGIDRQEVVVATKARIRMGESANQVGLSRSHLMYSVEDSLKRLGMDHIDLFYIHGVDKLTPLEETMRGLEDIVRSGKVRYIGISNHPAWQVMKANAYAEKMGWTRFEALQNYYSIGGRDIEREIVPLAEDQDLALMPWSPLAGGFLSGKYSRGKEKAGDSRRDDFDFPPIDKEKAYDIIDVMQEVADGHGVSVARVALAWVLQKKGVTSVIIGAKREEQLNDNLKAVELDLSQDEMARLDAVSELPKEYPGWMVERQGGDRVPQPA